MRPHSRRPLQSGGPRYLSQCRCHSRRRFRDPYGDDREFNVRGRGRLSRADEADQFGPYQSQALALSNVNL